MGQGTKTDTWDKAGLAQRPQLLGEGPILLVPDTSLPCIQHPALDLPPAFSLRLCSHLSNGGAPPCLCPLVM